MSYPELQVIHELEECDGWKIEYFVKLLIQQSKYRKLKEEIELRQQEIQQGQTWTHEEIWNAVNV